MSMTARFVLLSEGEIAELIRTPAGVLPAVNYISLSGEAFLVGTASILSGVERRSSCDGSATRR